MLPAQDYQYSLPRGVVMATGNGPTAVHLDDEQRLRLVLNIQAPPIKENGTWAEIQARWKAEDDAKRAARAAKAASKGRTIRPPKRKPTDETRFDKRYPEKFKEESLPKAINEDTFNPRGSGSWPAESKKDIQRTREDLMRASESRVQEVFEPSRTVKDAAADMVIDLEAPLLPSRHWSQIEDVAASSGRGLCFR